MKGAAHFPYSLIAQYVGLSQWPSGLRRGSAAARLLGLRVRIPPGPGQESSTDKVQRENKESTLRHDTGLIRN